MTWVYDDGGRRAAGFKGKRAGDCVCRAIAIATGMPYAVVAQELNAYGRRERSSRRRRGDKSSASGGVYKPTTRRYMAALGWRWTPTMGIGTGCRVHLREDQLPMGRLVVSVSRHVVAVIDGVVHDTYDPSRCGTRCVYGYWSAPA